MEGRSLRTEPREELTAESGGPRGAESRSKGRNKNYLPEGCLRVRLAPFPAEPSPGPGVLGAACRYWGRGYFSLWGLCRALCPLLARCPSAPAHQF